MIEQEILDPLYGELRFVPAIRRLVFTPAVQRLRHIRLSNVDSLSMPGFAGTTRYEHALGSAMVASRLGLMKRLSEEQRLVLQAAALIHDTAITPYGHLVEEAFACVGREFHHEWKWQQLADEAHSEAPGGAQLQIFMGRESGLRSWAEGVFGKRWRRTLDAVLGTVRGRGDWGPIVAGALDVDNMDNVTRAAFHIGLPCDKHLPLRLASSICSVDGDRLVFSGDDVGLVTEWLQLRRIVYGKLMAAGMDYSGKAMLLAAATAACEDEVITPDDWKLTDWEFTNRILKGGSKRAKTPLQRWLVGDLWSLGDVVWMRGGAPTLLEMYEFSMRVSEERGRCMAYRIVDKRCRRVVIRTVGGGEATVGMESDEWLFGIAFERGVMDGAGRAHIIRQAQATFGCEMVGNASVGADMEPGLFD